MTKVIAGSHKKLGFMDWDNDKSDSEKKEKKEKAVRRPRKKSTSPLFAVYIKMTDDPFWQDIFERASTGRFPKGFSFYEGNLVFKKGAKTATLPLSEEALPSVYEFFRKHGNLISPTEVQEVEARLKEQEIKARREKVYVWTDFSKQGKIQLLTDYACTLSKRYNLNRLLYFNLLSKLLIGLSFKYFDKEDVKMKGMQIENIKNLAYNSDTQDFAFQIKVKKIKVKVAK